MVFCNLMECMCTFLQTFACGDGESSVVCGGGGAKQRLFGGA